MTERSLIIGLITSTEYINQIQDIWDSSLLESVTARKLAGWCFQYYEQYGKAPGKDIENIYYERLKTDNIPKDDAEDIEEILTGLSKEFEEDTFNVEYLLDQTRLYLQEQKLLRFAEDIQEHVKAGDALEAEKLAGEYKTLATEVGHSIDLSTEAILERIAKAFDHSKQTLIKYPKQLGTFWNDQLLRGKFVALMASEKRGKSFWLLDLAVRASKQKLNVAFFQAGDMTEAEQLRRLCIYLTKRSDNKKYCGEMFQPTRDCILNQINDCTNENRECDFGIFEDKTEKEIRKEITFEELEEAYEDNPDYVPCYNCKKYNRAPIGAVWLEKVEACKPLTTKTAQEAVDKFFIKHKRAFKLSTHPNDTLSVKQIKAMLDIWQKQDGFTADVIVIDYADLLIIEEAGADFRHQQNKIWQRLRSLSQEKHCLVITATQADADSYGRNRLTMKNFSEDKRKIGHVTALFGLNQDKDDREKKMGIMRINELAIREGDFSSVHEVKVLQNLHRGRPFLGSYL